MRESEQTYSMSRAISDLHSSVRPLALKLMQECLKVGIEIVITQTLRTAGEQNALYAQGRTISGKIVTNARGTPPESIHQFGLAFDIAVKVGGKIVWDAEEYEKVGPIGEALGLQWGGRWKFKDLPHFEKRDGLTLQELRSGKRPLPVEG